LRWLGSLFHDHGNGCAAVIGDGRFGFVVVGTSHFQGILESIAGGRRTDGTHYPCAALILPPSDNPHSKHGVAVQIHGQIVGYLADDAAVDFVDALKRTGYERAACEAVIVGGWDRGPNDRGTFGVRLNAYLPFKFESADQWERRLRSQV
jgi:hypothetical protein